MARYILKRILGMFIVIFLVLTIAFLIVRLAPGDPAALMLGPEATPEETAALRTELGLDRPIVVQYFTFVVNAAQGDLGTSLFFRQPVTQVLAARAEPTIFLALFSLVFALVIATPIGIYAAYRRGSFLDQSAISTAMLAASIPSFWTGLMFQRYLATDLGLFPASGYGGPDASFIERMGYLILPSIVLGIVNSALILRFTRASMLDILGEDYIRTARSKGMGEPRVVLRHALKNAAIPIITVIGLTFALLVSGAVVTERVFNIPGMGNLVVSAVLRRDYPVIQGALIVVASLYVLINLVTDLLYLTVDKRVRY
ncbi:ABC transporter permease [Nitratireductor aquimarinus]|uniref:ABC transporter permease n=1 Tax=Alphaproteobacteria TaxID=28211 RepID=UPI0019D358BD|nr:MULTISPECIES: ABC transporter permease [Alphaproteobacteria]MBY6022584.1 ABC transporter permease [Nitratireductor sp. DP7N14-4]MBN7757793.1 ABC transporter permease [Nitratireductor aquimarinus]MBN7778020.1 ABC transporter permease [Nitratireductor pacificus]MBN7782342.1 ABC transporter permease [Nitratireductor pacificus]MBN7791149.1 ABC transporter permease [Nitratireductor aquimarinus]